MTDWKEQFENAQVRIGEYLRIIQATEKRAEGLEAQLQEAKEENEHLEWLVGNARDVSIPWFQDQLRGRDAEIERLREALRRIKYNTAWRNTPVETRVNDFAEAALSVVGPPGGGE